MNQKGVILQEVTARSWTKDKLSFPYFGISAYQGDPLQGIKENGKPWLDKKCLAITNEVFSRKLPDGMYQSLEFISSEDLMNRYVALCKKHEKPIRVLFVENDYDCEIWNGSELDLDLLGYEVSSIPIDVQIIGDLDIYRQFEKFKNMLNANGLFDTSDQALEFYRAYKVELETDEIDGDGLEIENVYICKNFDR